MTTKSNNLQMRVLDELTADVNKEESWFTPAFWTTVATALSNLITVAVLVGWVDATDAAEVSKAVVAMVGAVQVVFVNTALVWKYISGKREVEVAKLQARTAYISMLRDARG